MTPISSQARDIRRDQAGTIFDRLRDAAGAAASWGVVLRPKNRNAFPRRIAEARSRLRQLEIDLSAKTGKNRQGRIAVADASDAVIRPLRENPRLLRSAIAAVAEDPKLIAGLPRVAHADRMEEPRVATMARVYFDALDEPFSADTFTAFVNAVQEHEPLNLNELWNISAFLKFVLLEKLLDEASALRNATPQAAARIGAHLNSLRRIGNTDWAPLIEPLIVFDAILRKDPAGCFAAMDFESREFYRERIAFIARHSDSAELDVAKAALELARRAADHPVSEYRRQRRRLHVGYYIVGGGFAELAPLCDYHEPFIEKARAFVRRHADYFYITAIQLLIVLFVAALLLAPLPRYTFLDCLIIALLLVLPSSQCAVDLINNAITAFFDPHPLPKLNFRKGIPEEFTTLVAVPSLLISEDQVRELITELEVRYLGNRDRHLHFALLTDLSDSVARPHDKDSHPLVELAIRLIDQLNAKYGPRGEGGFLFLHRHRVFNRKQGVWMGWERKRGKLLDLNKLLFGEFDAFPIKAGRLDVLGKVRYVLTLDADTQLPRGTAAKLVGAMAHPLNQAVIDPRRRIVTEGFGILQPRIGVAVQSASRSRLAWIYSGQSGFDVYTRAVSDAYQELYGEGIFTGKGIYEVQTFHSVLDRRFPRNALLSHDLIEGAYARAGLVTDVELIDDYPSHYSAYTRRNHRWVRGDWQIARWLFARVPEESGHRVPNPISEISRWKILDNLRRSLVEPFTFVLLVAGWLGLPGGPAYWTSVALFLLFFPTLMQVVFSLGRAIASERTGAVSQAVQSVGQTLLLAVLHLAFLPHQTLMALDAIIRSLVRAFITGERLLEWETAAEAESNSRRRTAVDRYLALTPVVAVGIAILVYLTHPHGNNIFLAAPILLLWGFADAITSWLNTAPQNQQKRLTPSDRTFLLEHALRIWRFFSQFGGERHNYLIPDNVQEDELKDEGRVSPTNVGLLLNARQAACELGFVTLPEFVSLTRRSLETVARLEKYRGHLFNWYDTQTLAPVGTRMVSSVDSGNLVASLFTLQAGALDLENRPLLSNALFVALRAYWKLSPLHERRVASKLHLELPGSAASTGEWIAWIARASKVLAAAEVHGGAEDQSAQWWLAETARRIAAIHSLVCDYLPWLLPEYDAFRALPEIESEQPLEDLTLELAIESARSRTARIDWSRNEIAAKPEMALLAGQLKAALETATNHLLALRDGLRQVAQQAERAAQDTEFGFLMHPHTLMLSIGYDADAKKLHDACYDLLASEARIATFIAVARGELPQESWFKLSRDYTSAFGQLVLLSWTGTMFEYLMPALWMRSYPHTLIAKSLAASVTVQREFGASHGIPWGISESGAARRNEAGHYHYEAYGVPQIAIKSDAAAGPVVSPYSTFLALGVDPPGAIRNLRRMASAGFVGALGFYEAIDYSFKPGKAVPVREWMAHHEGMSLLAILNLLSEDIVQTWFHSIPLLQSAELMLHEMPVSEAVLRAKLKEFGDIASSAA